MPKLSKKTQVELATMINSLMVSEMLRVKSDNPTLWFKHEQVVTIELFKKYGIELPTLQQFLKMAEAK